MALCGWCLSTSGRAQRMHLKIYYQFKMFDQLSCRKGSYTRQWHCTLEWVTVFNRLLLPFAEHLAQQHQLPTTLRWNWTWDQELSTNRMLNKFHLLWFVDVDRNVEINCWQWTRHSHANTNDCKLKPPTSLLIVSSAALLYYKTRLNFYFSNQKDV